MYQVRRSSDVSPQQTSTDLHGFELGLPENDKQFFHL